MAITVCKKHGESGVISMCNHIFEKLNSGIYPSFFQLPIYKVRICKKCFEKYNLEKIVSDYKIDKKNVDELRGQRTDIYSIAPDYYFEMGILKEDNPELLIELELIYNSLNRKAECSDCVDKVHLDYAKKNDLPQPFEPFENTIMREDDKRITEIENLLSNYFNENSFKKSAVVFEGSIRKPLSIKIYGVTDNKEQKLILELIENYFKKITEKQRKIIFFETFPQKTEKVINSEMTSLSYIDGKILSEVIIK